MSANRVPLLPRGSAFLLLIAATILLSGLRPPWALGQDVSRAPSPSDRKALRGTYDPKATGSDEGGIFRRSRVGALTKSPRALYRSTGGSSSFASPRLPHSITPAMETAPYWAPTFALPGFDFTLWSAMVQYGSNLVVGSASEYFDGAAISQILQWDGEGWSSLGPGIEKTDCCSWVHDLVVFGPDLIVGGEFEVAGGDSARNIARWDDSDWSPMGPGLSWVNALAVLNNTLYAGTEEDGVCAWDGSTWSSLGVFDGPVYAMIPYGGGLAVAGRFSTVDGMSAGDYALWTGTTWIDIGGTGVDWHMSMSLAEFNGDLYAGGWFTEINGVPARGLARWDGTNWNVVGNEFIGNIEDLRVHDGDLYVSGSVPQYGVLLNGVARWDGSSWHSLGAGLTGLDQLGDALTTYNRDLVVLGSFSRAGNAPAWTIASWDGSTWAAVGNPVSQGVDQRPYVLESFQGKLVAGGPFVTAGMTDARRIAVLEGGAWQALGTGLSAEAHAVTEYDGDLVVGGNFLFAGGTVVNGIALWDGSSWSPLGSGMDAPVYALAVFNGDLVAGGEFATAGDVSASCIARWNGSSWNPLGSGTNNAVWSLRVYQGNLIAGGPMTTPANYIVQWDGSAWSPLGGGVGGWVRDLEIYSGQLIAGGDFASADGITVRYVARWNGVNWNSLTYGVNGTHWDTSPFVRGLTTLFGKLYVTGSFVYAGGVGPSYVVENIASWNGSSWSALDEGIDFCCGLGSWGSEAIGIGDRVYVGGLFGSASGVPSVHIGEWVVSEVTGVPTNPPIATPLVQLAATPNPFVNRTILSYALPKRVAVRLTIHDIQGAVVTVLVDEVQEPGDHTVAWTKVQRVNAPGLYFGRLAWGSQESAVKLLSLR